MPTISERLQQFKASVGNSTEVRQKAQALAVELFGESLVGLVARHEEALVPSRELAPTTPAPGRQEAINEPWLLSFPDWLLLFEKQPEGRKQSFLGYEGDTIREKWAHAVKEWQAVGKFVPPSVATESQAILDEVVETARVLDQEVRDRQAAQAAEARRQAEVQAAQAAEARRRAEAQRPVAPVVAAPVTQGLVPDDQEMIGRVRRAVRTILQLKRTEVEAKLKSGGTEGMQMGGTEFCSC